MPLRSNFSDGSICGEQGLYISGQTPGFSVPLKFFLPTLISFQLPPVFNQHVVCLEMGHFAIQASFQLFISLFIDFPDFFLTLLFYGSLLSVILFITFVQFDVCTFIFSRTKVIFNSSSRPT